MPPTPCLRPLAPDPKPQTPSLRPHASDPKPQTPSLRPQASDPKFQTPDLRPQGLKPKTPSLKPQVPGLRSAKTPRQATNFDDLRPQICENAAPGDERRRSQASDLRKRRAWRRTSTISSRRPAKTLRLAAIIDDLR